MKSASIHKSAAKSRQIARLIGLLLIVMAVAMAVPVAVSLHFHDGVHLPLIESMGVYLVLGLLLNRLVGYRAEYELHERESFWVTSVAWIVIPLVGALPYWLCGALDSVTDAAFEAVSGFTTTGSSVIEDPQQLPPGLLMWRSITQWIGGLGLILFIVAILRRPGVGAQELYSAEFSGTMQRKLHPHLATSVSRMWRIYALLTLALIAALILVGNNSFDACCIALSTISTGGFVTHAAGLTGYSHLTLAVLTLFMLMSGINMALLYNFFTLRWRQLRRNQEFVVYIGLFVVSVASCVLAFTVEGNDFVESVEYSLFHVASTISTCGAYMQSPAHWSFWVSVVTFVLMFVGASSGSTGGGIKLKRLLLLLKYVRNYFLKMIHPNAIITVKSDGEVVPEDYINKIFAFVSLYIAFVMGGAFVLTLCNSSIPNAICMAAANMGNLGPSPLINNLGASLDYIVLPDIAKWTLMLLMLAGRIEIFALLAIVSPVYWRNRR